MARLTDEKIAAELAAFRFTLISENYENLDTELEMECPEGHKVFRSLRAFRRDSSCPTCDSIVKKDFELKRKIPQKTKAKYRILALDQSTTTTGYSIFDDDVLLQSGIHSATNIDIVDRIQNMYEWFVSILHEVQPDCVVFEDIQKQENLKTFKHLAFLLGVLIIATKEHGISFKTFLATEWRKPYNITAGSRTDKKQAAKQKVISLYNFNPTTDESEAILIGRFYATQHKKKARLHSWV